MLVDKNFSSCPSLNAIKLLFICPYISLHFIVLVVTLVSGSVCRACTEKCFRFHFQLSLNNEEQPTYDKKDGQ